MKFKSAVIVSLLLHLSLGALAVLHPPAKTGAETTYYVDLINMGGGRGGNPGGSRGNGTNSIQGGVIRTPTAEQQTGSMKNLTVSEKPTSTFRYPDQEAKRQGEEKKLISVTRKEGFRIPGETNPTGKPGQTGMEGPILSIGTGEGDGTGDGSGGEGSFGSGAFPYGYYVETLKNKISSSWYNSLVTPGLRGKYQSLVYFKIFRNGEINELRLEKGSTIESLDLSSLRAIRNAAPFAPLPEDFPYPFLVVHFVFEWEK